MRPPSPRHGWSASASLRSGSTSASSCLRSGAAMPLATPTWCSTPSSSYRPHSSEPTPLPSLWMRKPAHTQSAVRSCLTFSILRSPGRYGSSSGLATTPSKPAPSKRENQSAAVSRSRVAGVTWIGGVASPSTDSRRARRSRNGCSHNDSSPSASRSNATYDAGISSASLLTREAAGCWRCCNASKSRPRSFATTSSPSSTTRSGSCSSSGSRSSGK